MSTSAGPEASTLAASSLLDSPREIEPVFSIQMGRILLAAMTDVVGRVGTGTILKNASFYEPLDHFTPADSFVVLSFSDVASVQVGLENGYGVRGGRVLAHRTGCEMFKYAQKELVPLQRLSICPDVQFISS